MKGFRRLLAWALSAALLAGAALPVTALEKAEDGEWIEEWQTPIASVVRTGDVDTGRINDGVLDNVTNTWEFEKPAGKMDYFGYQFTGSYTVGELVFYAGMKYGDGGWFEEEPVVRVLRDDVWREIDAALSPAYDAAAWGVYTFTFEPVDCEGIMVYGKPGGDARFISCAELKVKGKSGAPQTRDTFRYEFERFLPEMGGPGEREAQWMGDYGSGWSRAYHVLWKRAAGDAGFSFPFQLPAGGAYDLRVQATKAGDFGRFAFSIDGVQVGGEADCHGEAVQPALFDGWGNVTLEAGAHTFTVTALSDEPGSLLGGFDYFELQKTGEASTTEWIEGSSTPIASVVRDGDLALANIQDGNPATMTDLFAFGKTEENTDYIGYTFPETRTVSEVRYTEGRHYADGGWFREVPECKVYKDGEWTVIPAEITPAYLPGRSNEWGEYVFTFEPVDCDGVLISGKPGGEMFFTSCADLRVLAEKLEKKPRPEPEVTYSYADIAARLYDMEALAKNPAGETSGEFTSRDRASAYDTVSGDYKNWDANGDWTGYIRKQDDGGYVIAEMEGPGYINRLWMAYAWTGRVKIYIDGSETPALDERFVDLFTGDVFGYDELRYESVSLGGSMGGFDSYVPITYNESCKVVMYDSDVNKFGNFSYYIVGYTSLPETAAVESFQFPLSAENAAALDKADKALAARDAAPTGGAEKKETVKLAPGKSETGFTADGEGAISFLEVKPDEAGGDDLSDLILSIYWDSLEQPAVYTALGDFFATPAAPTPYESYVTGLREDGTFYARWFMPYGKGARIVLENRGDKERSVGLTVRTAALSDDLSAYARFGAEWNKLEDRRKGDSRWPDSRYFKAEGSGRYVGVSMHVYQIAQQIWWGEGDEKFFVDGEKTPSWFGTGSEDYFGYAWCQATPFNEPYHGQPLCEGARGTEQVQDAGNKVNYRYHITDSVPFQTSFDANMEKYFDDRFVKMAATTFFYLDPAASASHQVNRFTVSERDFNQIPAQQPALSYEGEDLSPYIRSSTGGNAVIQDMGYAATPDRKWSGDAQLWWKCGQEGGELSFTIHAPAAGDYDLSLRLTAAGDYGKLAVVMDGEPLEREADCYAADLSIIEADMGRVRLTAGEHVVTLRCTGKNSASAGYFIGLDRLDLQPVDVPLEGIELDAEALELEIGRGGQLTAALTPEYATDPVLVWKSENEKIVAVDQTGKLTARGVGTAVVTVSSAADPAVKAVCTVTVYRKGDLNADGAITVTDVMACCKVLARKSAGQQPSRDEVLRGDLTGEGGVTITDVMAICKLLAAKA